MIKGLIFDADGTLLDSMRFWMELTPRFLEKKGKTASVELETKMFAMSLEQGVAFLKSEFGLLEPEEEIKQELLSTIRGFYEKDIPLKAGAAAFLSDMKSRGLPMAVATSGNKALLEAAFTRLGVQDAFSCIVTCGELDTDKTAPAVYLTAAQRLHAKAEEIVVFEDALVPVRTAKQAGFAVVAVQDESSSADSAEIQALADLFIADFSDDKLRPFISRRLSQ
ncbi:MAG: HAD family phosphatase [Treponema sp.]|nr:HAD family phosphatase [Treponema sp.]